jgi:hypothetical protein
MATSSVAMAPHLAIERRNDGMFAGFAGDLLSLTRPRLQSNLGYP